MVDDAEAMVARAHHVTVQCVAASKRAISAHRAALREQARARDELERLASSMGLELITTPKEGTDDN